MKIFVPISDELLFEHPERVTSPLVPWRVGLVCSEWLEVRLEDTPAPAGRRGDQTHD